MAELTRPGGAAQGGGLRAARVSQPRGEIPLGMVPQLHYGKPEGMSSDAMEVMAFVDGCGRYDSDKDDDIPGLVSIRVVKNTAFSVGVKHAIKQPSTQDSASPADSFLRATQVVHRRCVLTKRSRGWKTEREGESAGEGGGGEGVETKAHLPAWQRS